MGFQFVRHQWRRLHHQGRDDGHCVGHLRDDGPILRTDGRRKHHQRTRGESISREFYSIFVYTKTPLCATWYKTILSNIILCSVNIHVYSLFYRNRNRVYYIFLYE